MHSTAINLEDRFAFGGAYTRHSSETATDFLTKLIDWLLWYNTERPHQSLGMLAPLQYYVRNLSAEECNMWWTRTCRCSPAHNALCCTYMAKRKYVDIRQKKSRSHKTKKRLAVKATMLAVKAAKRR